MLNHQINYIHCTCVLGIASVHDTLYSRARDDTMGRLVHMQRLANVSSAANSEALDPPLPPKSVPSAATPTRPRTPHCTLVNFMNMCQSVDDLKSSVIPLDK